MNRKSVRDVHIALLKYKKNVCHNFFLPLRNNPDEPHTKNGGEVLCQLRKKQ